MAAHAEECGGGDALPAVPMRLKAEEMLYVRSMGKLLRVTAVFRTDAEANAHMEKHRDEGLVAEFGELRLIAHLYDQGIPVAKAAGGAG